MALLRGLASLIMPGAKGQIVVAHFHHGLRGEEADADAAFVEELAQQLAVPCVVERRLPADCESARGRSEAGARSARYDFLRRTAHQIGARYVVTAHTADDQAETVLHRIVRGTGLTGLAGMRRARALAPGVTLLRPLLGFRRSEVCDYLAALGQPFRTDRSNHDRRYTRNRLRHELLPQLADEYNPRIVEALLRLGELAGDSAAVIDGLVVDHLEQSTSFTPRSVRVTTARLPASRHLLRELLVHIWRRQGWPLQAMSHAHWENLAQLVEASAKRSPSAVVRRHFPGAVLVEAWQGELRLTRQE